MPYKKKAFQKTFLSDENELSQRHQATYLLHNILNQINQIRQMMQNKANYTFNRE